MIILKSLCGFFVKEVEDHNKKGLTPNTYIDRIFNLTKATEEVHDHELNCNLCNSRGYFRRGKGHHNCWGINR